MPVYFPDMNIGGQGFGGGGFYWNQKPGGEASSAKIEQQRGSHYLKAGFEQRRSFGLTYVSSTSNFYFPAALTANTFNNPDTLHSGSGYATFLLGALDSQSQMIGGPAPDPHVEFYGMFIQDDWKVNKRITVNLGLRNEYETAIHDPNAQLLPGSRSICARSRNAGQSAADTRGRYRDRRHQLLQIQWPVELHQRQSPRHVRIRRNWHSRPGPASLTASTIRTVLRFGYARFLTPYELNIDQAPVSGYETVGFLEPPFLGLTGVQNTAPLLQGVPQQTISNPFPANNPLLPILGKGFGTNLGRGGQTSALVRSDTVTRPTTTASTSISSTS